MFDWLPDHIAEVGATAMAREQGWRFVMNTPAAEEAVRRCEEALGLALPPSYRAFLRRWDGASLFRQETPLRGGAIDVSAEIGIQGTRDLPAFQNNLRTLWDANDPGGWGSLVVFCRISGSGADRCALNPERSTLDGEFAVVDCHQATRPRCWRRAVNAPSFEAWLERAFDAALQGESPYFWMNTSELLAIYRQCQEEDQKELAESQARRARGLRGPLPSPSAPAAQSTASTKWKGDPIPARSQGARRPLATDVL